MASAKVLEHYREGFTIADAKTRSRGKNPAYSMANLYSGALGDLLCGVRANFKSVYGADIDKLSRRMYNDITGRICYKDVAQINLEKETPVTLMVITTPCPDYSSSNPDPQGAGGDKGGQEFVLIPKRVAMAQPLVVLVESASDRAKSDLMFISNEV